MKLNFKLLSAVIITLVIVGGVSAQTMMTINLTGKHVLSTDSFVFEIMDTNCNRSLGNITVKGNDSVPLSICKNTSGYGNIKYRNVTLKNSWVGASMLHDGEEVSP